MSQKPIETSVPVRAWDVRKRRKPNGAVLIRLCEVFAISPFEEQIWRLCDGQRSLEHLAHSLSLPSMDCNAAHALERVKAAVIRLAARGMLEVLPAGAIGSGSPRSAADSKR
jgi:hypothetical protein